MMASPLLSILIPTTPDRGKHVSRLLECLSEQYYNRKTSHYQVGKISAFRHWDSLSKVEILIFDDDKTMTIGEKRELLYKDAKGKYSWQVDSDDLIGENAIELILQSLDSEPDCVTFEEHIDIDGKIERSNHSLTYADWEGEGGVELWDGFHYHRTPFFKSVIRTDIARSVPIPWIRFGEDHQWAQALKPVLKNEIHIPQELYKYIHRSSNFNERYGFDRA